MFDCGHIAAGPAGDYQIIDLDRCGLAMKKKFDCRIISSY